MGLSRVQPMCLLYSMAQDIKGIDTRLELYSYINVGEFTFNEDIGCTYDDT
jgi:hypothetical protein